MARLTLILTILTTIIGLFGGFAWVMSELRAMRERRRVTGRWLILVLLFLPSLASAQNWSGIIDQNRASDWSYAGAGTLPTRPILCTTLSPGVTTAQINTALTNCAATPGRTVLLAAGTYTLTGTIVVPSNTTLRGSGPTQTVLNMSSGGANCDPGSLVTHSICLGPPQSIGYYDNPTHLANWTAGFTKGTTVITLSVAPTVGQKITLDQPDDAVGSTGLNVTNIGGSLCRGASIGARNCYTQYTLVQNVTGAGPYQVTISPPLQGAYWQAGKNPHAYWIDHRADFGVFPVVAAGIEDLKIVQARDVWFVIVMKMCTGCWVKNIASIETLGSPHYDGCCGGRAHVGLVEVMNATVRDSYFYGTHSANTQSYGVEDDPGGFNLVENNIFEHIVAPIVPGTATSSVYGYNYMIDNLCLQSDPGPYPPSAACNTTQQMGAIQPHDAGSMLNLFEGNQGNIFAFDYLHGSTPMNTLFRNQMGQHEAGKDNNLQVLYFGQKSRYMNVLGNVFGEGGLHTLYQSVATAGVCENKVYALGYSSFGSCGGGTITDGNLVRDTAYRFGNYDVATNATRWCGNSSNTGWATTCASASEVPTADAFYPQAVPASESFPASFYRVGTPEFWSTPWGTPGWPVAGPDVTGGNVAVGTSSLGGHAWKNPARLCYENTSVTAGIKNFDANACYGAVQQAPPPVTRFYLRFAEIILLFGSLIWKCRVPLFAGCIALGSLTQATYHVIQLNAPIYTAKTVYHTKALAAKAIASVLPRRK